MIQRLLEIVGNSHFEAYIGGPLAGLIAAMIFSGFSNSSGSASTAQNPRDIRIQIIQQFADRNRNMGRHGAGNTDTDGSPFFLFMLISAALGFLFAAYLPQISLGLYVVITSVATFSIATCVLSILSGRFNTFAWWQHTIIPTIISLICFVIVAQAEKSISPEVVNFAHSLLGSGYLSLRTLAQGTLIFYKNLSNDYVQWLGFQMAAFVFALLSALTAFLQCIHYVALSNARTSNSLFWSKLAIWTARFDTIGTTAMATLFLLLAGLFAHGEAYRFLHG